MAAAEMTEVFFPVVCVAGDLGDGIDTH